MWVGELNLAFARSGAKTVIARRRHRGPLLVQRAFYEPDGGCQAYVLHPPGGVVGGDQLSMSFDLGPGAHALVTTPAATKIYRSPDRESTQEQLCRVAAGGVFEWLPQETIVFDGARAQVRTRVELGQGSHFIGWEVTCLGHNPTGFSRGRLVQRWTIEREGRPLWGERALFEGGGAVLSARWGLAGRPVVATLVGTGARAEHVEAIRAALPETTPDWLSVTRLGEVLICRYLGYSAEAAKRFLCAGWTILRQGVSGRVAHHPRVWAT
jgi:urease accessory protein